MKKKKARRGLAGDRAAPQETSTCLGSLSRALVVRRGGAHLVPAASGGVTRSRQSLARPELDGCA
jgi:hypothetical protein